jgi:hypothetical protein
MTAGTNDTASATRDVTINAVDDPPTAVDDSATVAEDSAATAIDVLANDTDTDGGPRSVQSTTQPANGVVVITGGAALRASALQPPALGCPQVGARDDSFVREVTPHCRRRRRLDDRRSSPLFAHARRSAWSAHSLKRLPRRCGRCCVCGTVSYGGCSMRARCEATLPSSSVEAERWVAIGEQQERVGID